MESTEDFPEVANNSLLHATWRGRTRQTKAREWCSRNRKPLGEPVGLSVGSGCGDKAGWRERKGHLRSLAVSQR